jgi:hypothetical protein
MSEIKFLKIRDVKSPERGTDEAAGIDFFVPEYNPKFKEILKKRILSCFTTQLRHQCRFILIREKEC